MKNVRTLLSKSVLMPLGLASAASADVDAGIHKKSCRFWNYNIYNIK